MNSDSANGCSRPSLLEEAARFDFVSKLGFFPEKTAEVLRLDPVGALSVVYLDVNTNICNHSCMFCDGFYRPLQTRSIPTRRLFRLVDEMVEVGVLAVVLAGDRGEPLLHPGLTEVLSRIAEAGIFAGIYTNGTVVPEKLIQAHGLLAWIRISVDAATADTHRIMHGYPKYRDDFSRLMRNLPLFAEMAPDLGVSFILDSENVCEIEQAADVLLGAGAHFIEYKPKYLPDYTPDAAWLAQNAREIKAAIDASRRTWGDRVVVNNQVAALLDGSSPPTLVRDYRQCLTSLLRMVISTHGCYPCTPYRGDRARRFGDILSQTLREVLNSPERLALIDHSCNRICAYDRQNDYLLDLRDGRADLTLATSVPRPQDAFV
ncbi:MAG: radical SAM protein [Pseudonocardiaceae bacterium]